MMPLGENFYRRKVTQIRAQLEAHELDGILLLDTYNVIYASGFVHIPSERPIGLYIPGDSEPTLFVPFLERENAADTWVSDIRTYFEYPGETNPIAWMLTEIKQNRLGVDAISYNDFQVLPYPIVTTQLVEKMRWVKEPEELALTQQAAGYADYCLEFVRDNAIDIIRDGGTEVDILQAAISATSTKMISEVGETFGKQNIRVVGTVHSGVRAALPHGTTIERQPLAGEPLIAGIGAMVGGYHAESGATFIIGEPQGDQMQCLQAAVACDTAAVDALRAGTPCHAINEAALNVLKEAGLGDAIRHRIGHGMGLQGHESPWLAPGDETTLQANMVFSNEPGIYRPGLDGYRTINSMVVTNGEAEVYSRFLANNPPEKRVLAL